MSNEEIAQELIAIAKTKEQVQFITAKADVTLLTKIAVLEADVKRFEERLYQSQAETRITHKLLLDTIHKIITSGGSRDSCC
jgi:hypothetical protein